MQLLMQCASCAAEASMFLACCQCILIGTVTHWQWPDLTSLRCSACCMHRCPTLANSALVASLDEAGTVQLQQATELAQLYSLNKCTPDIWQALISSVEAEGSLAGMLRKLTVPLMHNGYELAKCKDACDWQYQHMSAADADAHLSSCVRAFMPAT